MTAASRRTREELQQRRAIMSIFGGKKTPKQQMQAKVARNVSNRKLDNAMKASAKVDRIARKAAKARRK